MRITTRSFTFLLLIASLGFTFACAENQPVSADPITEEVTLAIPSGTLYGTLTLPHASGTFPVALIIAGSGPTDRNGNSAMLPGKNNSLKMIADSLAQHGIASLRYDKRGVAASQAAAIQESDLRFDDFVADAVEWIKQLQQDERFSQVTIIGHSEGSLIGMLAARLAQTDAYVSIAGPAQPADSMLLEQLSTQPDFFQQEARAILSELRQGRTVDSLSLFTQQLFRPSVQPYLISWIQYNPAEEIAKLQQPVLILQGTTDLQVSPKEAQRLAAANPQAERAIIARMNHVLKNAPAKRQENIATYSQSSLPLAEGLMEKLVEFLK